MLTITYSVGGGGCEIRTHAPVKANGFQDRLVMTTSITLRKYDATACIIFTELKRCGSMSVALESTSHTTPEDRQARLSGVGCRYHRRRRYNSP